MIIKDYLPKGNFESLVKKGIFKNDAKLVRTYFKQLIDGLSYIHSKDIAHMDLKPSSLLLGEDFRLKISNFDQCIDLKSISANSRVSSIGSEDFRAPEIKMMSCEDPHKADIFSLGLILFYLAFGFKPCAEEHNNELNGSSYELMLSSFETFWELHRCYSECAFDDCDKDLKRLLSKLLKSCPSKRLSFDKIRRDKWFKGETYNHEELSALMKNKLAEEKSQ